jgi:hypothetical protein
MRGPLAPLEREPVSVRAPFVSFPGGRYRPEHTPECRAALLVALDGVELGAYDERVLEWLAGGEVPVAGTGPRGGLRRRPGWAATCSGRWAPPR